MLKKDTSYNSTVQMNEKHVNYVYIDWIDFNDKV